MVQNLINNIYEGYEVTKKDIDYLITKIDVNKLFKGADKIREHFMGKQFDLCSIMNAKSGRCSENCKYCAQSSHYNTGIEEYPLITKEVALKRAIENSEYGIKHFSLVTSGRGLNGKDFDRVLDIFLYIKERVNIKLCASLGIINYEQALQLKDAGVSTYHHNIETSERFFKNICTTHTYKDRIETIKEVKRAGLNICSGGIIGLGEEFQDRIDMAFTLRDLKISSVPINVLNPIKGTPLEKNRILQPEEILKTIALFRYILPKAYIRYAGGRKALQDKQAFGLSCGVNAALVGNYLTTTGKSIKEDLEMIQQKYGVLFIS